MAPFERRGRVEPAILSGIRDQHGKHWVCYGTPDRHILFSFDQLLNEPNLIFSHLAAIGKRVLTNKAKDAFRQEVEAFDAYEDRHVIFCSGWTGGVFRYGDGSIFKSRTAPADASIATLEPDAKAGQSCDLTSWQDAVGGFVEHQPLVLFILAYACVGPILAFAPVDIQNPIVEIVGPKQQGKTTLGIGAGSLWGGHPDSSCGFGVTWDLTAGAIDDVMETHRDQLMYLEEANLSGRSDAERSAFVSNVLFKLTSSARRLRLNDSAPLVHVRTAVLSTSNIPMRELIGVKSEAGRAALSRVLTVHANRQFGIFDSVPRGHVSAGSAVQAFHRVAAANYGAAARHLVQALAERHSLGRLSADVAACFENYLHDPVIARCGDGRQAKILAITCAAHKIATHFGVLPCHWGSILDAVGVLDFDKVDIAPKPTPAADRLGSYIEARGPQILDLRTLERPLPPADFDQVAGIWLDADILLIATAAFHAAFADHRALLQELRADDILRGEGGTSPKMSRKAPAAVCAGHGRRGYFFNPPQTPSY